LSCFHERLKTRGKRERSQVAQREVISITFHLYTEQDKHRGNSGQKVAARDGEGTSRK
jgi:hypothetical protein